VVKSTKMTRTIVVRRDYLHYIKKYARCVRLVGV
jgi:small subunit ribosomal protein S11e